MKMPFYTPKCFISVPAGKKHDGKMQFLLLRDKQTFNGLVNYLREDLSLPTRFTTFKEVVAKAMGFNSSNEILTNLPVLCELDRTLLNLHGQINHTYQAHFDPYEAYHRHWMQDYINLAGYIQPSEDINGDAFSAFLASEEDWMGALYRSDLITIVSQPDLSNQVERAQEIAYQIAQEVWETTGMEYEPNIFEDALPQDEVKQIFSLYLMDAAIGQMLKAKYPESLQPIFGQGTNSYHFEFEIGGPGFPREENTHTTVIAANLATPLPDPNAIAVHTPVIRLLDSLCDTISEDRDPPYFLAEAPNGQYFTQADLFDAITRSQLFFRNSWQASIFNAITRSQPSFQNSSTGRNDRLPNLHYTKLTNVSMVPSDEVYWWESTYLLMSWQP